MQYPLFLLSHPVGNLFFCRSDILQQTLIQSGRKRNLVDKVHHFAPFYSKLRDCRGRYFWLDECRKSVGYSPVDAPSGTGRGEDADGDCGGILDKVKTWDAALIGKMKLSEWNKLFIFPIAFSCITGLLLYLIFRNRSRQHPLPARPGYVRQSTVSDWFSDVSCFIAKFISGKHEFTIYASFWR